MKNTNKRECPGLPDNAEESLKCKQCGSMITVSSPSAEEALLCPVCGATMSAADLLATSTSNEDY